MNRLVTVHEHRNFSRQDAKTAKVFPGELCAFARVIIEI